MLIVFLLRTTLSETIKLSGASRRHVVLHPAAISTRARSFHREYANNVAFERDAGFRISDAGYWDPQLVDEVANCMIIAAASDCWFGVAAAATD
jgi:hypothetical protein